MWFCAILEDLDMRPALNEINSSLRPLRSSLEENYITVWDNVWDVSADSP